MRCFILLACVNLVLGVCPPSEFIDLPDCADGVVPEKDDKGCPLVCKLKRIERTGDCTPEVLKVCRDESVLCKEGEGSSLAENGCCLTCVYELPPAGGPPARPEGNQTGGPPAREGPARPSCTDDLRAACGEAMKTMAECTEAEPGTFDPATCCPTCKRVVEARCAKEEMVTCLTAAPVCEDGVEAERVEGQCCPSCKRANSGASMRDIAACPKLDECAADVMPELVKSTDDAVACPSCKVPKPTCETACADGEVCVRGMSGSNECKGKKAQQFIVRGSTDADKTFLADATAENIEAIFTEIVERFCEQAHNEDDCTKFKDPLLDGLTCSIVDQGSDEVVVDVNVVTVQSSGSGRRLLVVFSADQLLTNAVADPASSGDFEVGRKQMGCPKADLEALTPCDVGEIPTRSTGCPSCQPPVFDQTCITPAAIETCRALELPACAEGEKPQRDGCCLTCLPKPPTCTDDTKAACDASMPNLPECEEKIEGVSFFNKELCCPTCKRPARENPNAACAEEMKTCLDTTHLCGDTEVPVREPGQCCASCRRAARGASLRDVAKCASIPECLADEVPTFVEGEAGAFSCPTCRPGRPTCDPTCTENQVCVRSLEDSTKNVCKIKLSKELTLSAAEALDKEFVETATAESIEATLEEIVERYCDNSDYAAECEYKTELLDGLIVQITAAAEGGAMKVDVTVPDTAPSRRRLLQEGSASTLLDSAVADPDATGGFSVQETDAGDDGSTDPPTKENFSGAMSLMPSSSVAVLAATLLAVAFVTK